jgi:hypothetical protein
MKLKHSKDQQKPVLKQTSLQVQTKSHSILMEQQGLQREL